MKDLRPGTTPRRIAPLRKINQPAQVQPVTRDLTKGYPGIQAYVPPTAGVLLDRSFRELVRYYRHSGVGRLCRAIVHRMNTPLQVLSFQVELLEQKSLEEREILPECRQPAREKLQALQGYRLQKIRQFRRELENLRALVCELALQGAHEEAEERNPLDLNELCRRELELYLANSFFKDRVEKHFSFQEGLPSICGHYIDFSQCFRNLLENALEAMEGTARCRLTVTTAFKNDRCLLRIGDTGTGIPPEIMPRIFEPFFTTKGNLRTERAGLGLFMALRLMVPYGGEIRVKSFPGETWVTVALPVK